MKGQEMAMKPAYFPVLILFKCSVELKDRISSVFLWKFAKKPVAMGIMKRKKFKNMTDIYK